MKNPIILPIPSMKALLKLGQDINLVRRRRRIEDEKLPKSSFIDIFTMFNSKIQFCNT